MVKTITIFGGSGFIGSYIVRQLSQLGYRIIIPTSNYLHAQKLRIYGNAGQILIIRYNHLNREKLENIINDSDYIINLRTIWQEKQKIKYNDEIFEFNKLLINLSNQLKIKKYIFFSGIGTNVNSKSKRIKTISQTEDYIKNNFINYSIIRPSIVIGPGDNFLTKLIPIFKLFFFIPLFGSGESKLQPVYVNDVAKAVTKLIKKNKVDGNIYELGGREILSYKELYKFIINTAGLRRILFILPFWLAKILIFFIEKLSLELINREQLELFKTNNLVGDKFYNFYHLDIIPCDVKQIIKKMINNEI